MLEAAGCSTRNGQQTLEVLLRTLAILELHKRELRTQDKTYIDNPHRPGSEVPPVFNSLQTELGLPTNQL